SVLTYGTSTPEKGGIDSAASAFRLFRTDAQGNPTSELRYAPADGVLVANRAKDGTLTVNAYKTSAATTAVTADDQPLKQASPWAWTLPEGNVRSVTARFADGSTLTQ
ncbi:hypothetical protein VPJ68_01820, partial [Parabacteroides distasonis]